MSEQSRVLVVLHGDRVNIDELPLWAAHANAIVAADGGVEHLLSAGISPDVVTGDFDGLVESVRANLPSEILIENGDQNTTDCQKALSMAVERFGATDIVVFGAEGSRVDHMLATLGVALATKARVRVIFDSSIVHFVERGDRWTAPAKPGCLVSMFAFEPTLVSRTSGLKWDAGGLTLRPTDSRGVSNQATSGEISAEVESGCLAVFVGRFEGDIRW